MNNFIRLLKQKKTIIFLSVVVGLGAVIFLVFRYIAPFGKVVYYRFGSKLPGTQESTIFSPGKNNILKIPAQIITTSTSKLQLKLLSSDVETIKATLKFKPNVNEILFGVRGSEKDNFIYRPLYRDTLYLLSWNKMNENGFTLWQKTRKYQTLPEFINNPSLNNKVAFYFADIDKLQSIESNKLKGIGKTIIETSLRGSLSLLVKVDKPPLVLKIAKQDKNAYDGEDKYRISVLKDQVAIFEDTIEDDGITDTSKLINPQEKTITLDGKPGIYQINIVYDGEGGDSDITKLEVNQQKLIFKNNIFIDIRSKPTTIWTNSSNVTISTPHDGGTQKIKLNDKEELNVDQRGKAFPFNLESLTGDETSKVLYKLESPKNDLNIGGNGYFSLSEEAFFNPEIMKATDLNTLGNIENVDYVLSTYSPSKKEGEWMTAEVSFNPKQIKIEGDKLLYFSLEIPQIVKYGGSLEIEYLEIEVKSKGILDKTSASESKDSKTSLSQDETKIQNIFSQVSDWTAEKLTAVGKVIVETFNSVWNWGRGVFGQTPTPAPVPSAKITPKSSPTPTAASSAVIFTSLVRVLNGGAEKGAAASVSATLKSNGFANVEANNADNQDYKGVTINYRKDDIKIAEKIELLLKNAYGTVTKTVVATSAAETVVILGKK